MDSRSIQLFAIAIADRVFTEIEDETRVDAAARPLVLYLVAAKLRAAADRGGNGG